MWLFVAVFPPPEALADLSHLVDRLVTGRTRARVVAPERLHLTLAFLGEVSDDAVTSAAAALSEAAADVAAKPIGELAIAGGGIFGRGRVLWAGCAGDVPGLIRAARTVRRALRAHRVPPDKSHFQPHITLARPGDRLSREDLEWDVAQLRQYAGPTWRPTELALVGSRLGPHPAYHHVLVVPST